VPDRIKADVERELKKPQPTGTSMCGFYLVKKK
jgi:hypothetical protein